MKVYFNLSLEGFSNCYVVTNPEKKAAIIIDPGTVTKEILLQIEREQLNLEAVLITHNHESHLKGLATLRKIYTPKIYAADYEVADRETQILKDDGILRIGGLQVGYMSVPGHTPDSMVFKIGKVLFTGDALTASTLGSTTNTYAERMLLAAVHNKILSQHDDTVIMPGHGPPSSVAAEKKFNTSVVVRTVSGLDDKG
ncbi:MAG TPA: MBL fold metallo-hydrolase [Treponemataceae bacterium]|jgi:glyoxylase-like metal-dependent hydrolase (beta-lactamase superfamily II)|nr:MBL fold metallo-hydrolase [Treponemataceae bacterium]HQC26951.1 MBL fold metallo-hydrolase [Treponemataceae bacterium]